MLKHLPYKWQGTLLRIGRVLLYGALTYALQYVAAHQAGWNIPEYWLPVIAAVLTGADKWVREHLAGN